MIKLLFCLIFLWSCGKPIVDHTDDQSKSSLVKKTSSETLLEIDMSLNFDLLPLQGKVSAKDNFWSGDSWQLNRGAINYRWNSSSKESFNYLSPTTREFFSMPLEQMKTLSPAEKYDLYKGRYDYPLKMEVDWLARTGTEPWEGLCHGWAAASVHHAEPQPVVLKNPDGFDVPFGSSDIKALLSYAYSKSIIHEGESLGRRCEEMTFYEDDNCNDDLTALSFHAVLTNTLGLRGQSIIADLDRYKEVWNHPVTSYESQILSLKSNSKGKVAIVSTQITYVEVIEQNSWNIIHRLTGNRTYKYQLTLDNRGNMVDSKWLTIDRPDFLWKIKKQNAFEGYLSDVFHLLKK